MLVLKENVIFDESETKVLGAVMRKMCEMTDDELTRIFGVLGKDSVRDLERGFYFLDFYRRHGILEARPLTDDELMEEYEYRFGA